MLDADCGCFCRRQPVVPVTARTADRRYTPILGCCPFCDRFCMAHPEDCRADSSSTKPNGLGYTRSGTGGVLHSGGATTVVMTSVPSGGGVSGLDGALIHSGGNSTLSGGTSALIAKLCDPDANICESPVVLAANQDTPGSMALDATQVYWTHWDGKNAEIRKVPLDGGVPTTIVSGQDGRRACVSEGQKPTTVTGTRRSAGVPSPSIP